MIRRLIIMSLCLFVGNDVYSQVDSLSEMKSPIDSLAVPHLRKRPLLAATEVVGLNGSLLAFDHYVKKYPWYDVSMATIKRNIKLTEWWWDADNCWTNLVYHPVHGAAYYNAARGNGMSMGVSALYATGGSLMWEIMGENELPSVSDIITTPVGGIAVGEVQHRVSTHILDNRARGLKRVGKEALGFLFNPMNEVNRLITGEAWKVRGLTADEQYEKQIPMNFSMAVGYRKLHTSGVNRSDLEAKYPELSAEYGDIARVENNKPYDEFDATVGVTIAKKQDPVGRIAIRGRLLGYQLTEGKANTVLGLYQHFGYYSTEKGDEKETPYILSEAASGGVGLVMQTDGMVRFTQQFYANAIGLGASLNDYRGKGHWRNYNFGSGFGLKSHSSLKITHFIDASFNTDYYRIFTWSSYEDGQNCKQGDAGCTWMLLMSPKLSVNIYKGIGLEAEADYYKRHTRYKYHDTVHSHTWEVRAGVVVKM